MSKETFAKVASSPKSVRKLAQTEGQTGSTARPTTPMPILQRLGNAAVQRLLAQRSASGPAELDDALTQRITSARGGGSVLDANIQKKMGEGMGADFSQVRVHTGKESRDLNHRLSARAFTTGRDIFFGDGEYDPHSSGGQELIAHELAHVVQQSSGAVPPSGRMTVNAPGDRFEQEADAVADAIGSTTVPPVQRAALPEDEEAVQAQEDEDAIAQMQELPEEEEPGTT
jgi:hypothetical protein